jgi:hypothetical protein
LAGFILRMSNDLHKTHWQSLEEEYPNLEIYFEYGWYELMLVYKNAIYLSLSIAIKRIIREGLFDKINMKSNFFVVIQEHDCGARLIMKKRA